LNITIISTLLLPVCNSAWAVAASVGTIALYEPLRRKYLENSIRRELEAQLSTSTIPAVTPVVAVPEVRFHLQ
jgi:hypothetical protein